MQSEWQVATVASVCALLVLQSLQKTTEYVFSTKGQKYNQVDDSNHSRTIAAIISWIYTCRYPFPVLGGLLACKLGHVRVLQIGGGAMLLTTIVISIAVYLNRWKGDSGITLAACLLMPVMNGLIIPNVMQGILTKRTAPRYRTVLCALIYASSAGGKFTGIKFSNLEALLPVWSAAVVCLAVAVLYCVIALSLSLPCAKAAVAHDAFHGAEEDAALSTSRVSEAVSQRIQLPTQNRLKRSCLVFAAFIPYLIGDESGYFFVGKLSFQALTNASGGASRQLDISSSDSSDPLTSDVRSVGVVVSNLCLVVAACLIRRSSTGWRLPIIPRLLFAISLTILLEISLATLSSGAVILTDQTALNAIYLTASLIESVSAVLMMVAAYEVMDGFERDAARPLIVGVMLTVWGLANVLGRLLTMACLDYLPARLQFVYHVILALLLLISLLYIWFLAMPLAKSLTVTYSWEDENKQRVLCDFGETESLLGSRTGV